MNQPTIRFIKKEDIPQLVCLCKAHAEYEKSFYDSRGKVALLTKHLFHAATNINCLVVEHNKELVGYASYLKQFSTWEASYYLYLDCLFLSAHARGKGLGKKLMEAIRKEAIKENCNLQWQTPRFNVKAIKFYQALGATPKTKERFFWEVL